MSGETEAKSQASNSTPLTLDSGQTLSLKSVILRPNSRLLQPNDDDDVEDDDDHGAADIVRPGPNPRNSATSHSFRCPCRACYAKRLEACVNDGSEQMDCELKAI